MGIRTKFILIIVLVSIISAAVIGAINYKLSQQTTLAEAKEKGELLFDYIQASKDFFRKHQRPMIDDLLVDKNRFYPEIMSGFVVQRMEFDIFKQKNKGFIFKQATLDPLWPDNKANSDEEKIIRYFQQNQSILKKEGTIKKDGRDYFFIAQPVSIEKKFCLKCHSDPSIAPQDQKEIYGTKHGYNWKMGDIVGASFVYISISEALKNAQKNALVLLSVGTGCLFIFICLIWFFLDRKIVAPIVKLSALAQDISIGKNLLQKIEITSKDEVGDLTAAINRLQYSVRMLLKRNKPKRQ